MSLAIETFAENVRHFCQWAESSKHDLPTARQLLLALLQGIPYLTASEAEDKHEREYARRTPDEGLMDISQPRGGRYGRGTKSVLKGRWDRKREPFSKSFPSSLQDEIIARPSPDTPCLWTLAKVHDVIVETNSPC